MNVHVSNFFELVKQEWNYPSYEDDSKETQLVLRSLDADVTGGKMSKPKRKGLRTLYRLHDLE